MAKNLKGRRSNTLDAPSWLWNSVVDLVGIHQSAFLNIAGVFYEPSYAAGHISAPLIGSKQIRVAHSERHMPDAPNWYLAATLAIENHVYCAGTLAQCVRRWQRLSEVERQGAIIRQGRDGIDPHVITSEQIAALAAMPGLKQA